MAPLEIVCDSDSEEAKYERCLLFLIESMPRGRFPQTTKMLEQARRQLLAETLENTGDKPASDVPDLGDGTGF